MILQCATCGDNKDADSGFFKAPGTKRGYRIHCKVCRAKYYRDWSNNNRIKAWLNGIRKRSRARSLDFNLVAEELVIPEVCPVLGIPLHFGKSHHPNLPSIDRFDNTKGYTKENTRIISYRANKLKNDATLEEMESVVKYMKGL